MELWTVGCKVLKVVDDGWNLGRVLGGGRCNAKKTETTRLNSLTEGQTKDDSWIGRKSKFHIFIHASTRRHGGIYIFFKVYPIPNFVV